MAGTADTVTRRTVVVVDVAVGSWGVAVGAVAVSGWASGAAVGVGRLVGSTVVGGAGRADVVSAAGVAVGNPVVIVAADGLAPVFVSFPT